MSEKEEKIDLRKLVLSAMQGPPKKDWDYEKESGKEEPPSKARK